MTKPTKPTQKPPQLDRAVADMPVQLRAAQIVPASFNEADRTVDVVWTTGSRRRAYDWYNDTPYEEELAVTPDAVDMSRFEAGTVQVLDGHNVYGGVRAILGIATSGSISGGEGNATLRLSGNPDNAGVVGDIQAGIIRSISFGYSVQRYEITRAQDRTDGVNLPLYRAVAWTPQEISFVPVPADANASTRSQPAHGLPCEFIRAAAQPPKATNMNEAELQAQRDQEAATRAAAEQATQAAAAAAQAAERTRAADIAALCTRHAVPAERAQQFITDGTAIDAVRTEVLNIVAERDAGQGNGQRNVTRVHTVSDEVQTRLAGLEEAFMHRVDAAAKLTDNGRLYRGMSLMEMGREHLERSNIDTRGMTRMALATQILTFRSGGMLSTSDFSNLLANVANKRLRQGYDENAPSYQRWARRAPDAPDFKSMSVVNLAGAPDLLKVNEHGEFKYGAMTDGKETYSMLTYGRIVSLTRQALINDDLRGFDRLVGAFGNSAARLENRTVYAILTANAALADTGTLFNATAVTTAGGHANYTGTGTAISVASLGVGRAAMRVQKGLQSEELNLTPSFLIVPAAIEQVAYQYTSANYVPALASSVNEFRAGGRTALEPIVEAILDANSATAWYLAASTGQIDTVEYCYLQGAAGPVIESEMGFEVDGISYKCRLDFAAKAIDFRGLYKNAGA
ncbi:MAG: prohead protease/major capsid protein fusion protein [Burkholderiaceae bacterium]